MKGMYGNSEDFCLLLLPRGSADLLGRPCPKAKTAKMQSTQLPRPPAVAWLPETGRSKGREESLDLVA